MTRVATVLKSAASLCTSGPEGFSTVTAPCFCSRIFIPLRSLRADGQSQRERAALVELALERDLAAVQADDFACQCQAKAGAGDFFDARVFGSIEALEDALGVFIANAKPRVGYRE